MMLFAEFQQLFPILLNTEKMTMSRNRWQNCQPIGRCHARHCNVEKRERERRFSVEGQCHTVAGHPLHLVKCKRKGRINRKYFFELALDAFLCFRWYHRQWKHQRRVSRPDNNVDSLLSRDHEDLPGLGGLLQLLRCGSSDRITKRQRVQSTYSTICDVFCLRSNVSLYLSWRISNKEKAEVVSDTVVGAFWRGERKTQNGNTSTSFKTLKRFLFQSPLLAFVETMIVVFGSIRSTVLIQVTKLFSAARATTGILDLMPFSRSTCALLLLCAMGSLSSLTTLICLFSGRTTKSAMPLPALRIAPA